MAEQIRGLNILHNLSDLMPISAPVLVYVHGEEIDAAQSETESESEGSDSEQVILK
jgi:hypothetical protein